MIFMHYIILCRSLTAAQRGVRLLRNAGIFASVTKAPQSANPYGCAYGVKLGERNLTRGRELLRENGIPGDKLFSLDRYGAVQEVWL